MKLKFLFISLFIFSLSFAQNKGTVTGTITDKDMNNETLPFASVAIKGTTIGANTDEDGKYKLSVPAGTHTIVFAFLGYETVEMQVTIAAGETKVINQALASTSVEIEEVVIQRTVSREKESALLLEQKEAVTITQAIGAQEMSRKGVSDAEGAVTKVTGISKQQGERNVFVRGLGDRYNSTTMNGMPLPSDNPEYKNISLDYFSSDIIKNIGVNKTFSSQLYGDIAGANIDIISKELSGDSELELGVSVGANSRTLSKDFLIMDGSNFLGAVPNKGSNVTNLNVYSFENSLNPSQQSTQINSALSLAGGKRYNFGDDSFSVYLVGSHSGGYKFREGPLRQTTSTGTIFKDQTVERYTYNATQTAMGNFKYRFGAGHTIALNSLYIHSNTQTVGDYFGTNNPEQEGDLEFMRRQQMNNNNLLVNQLLSEVKLSDRLSLDLGASFGMVNGDEPDRRSNTYIFREGTFRPSTNSAGDHKRYFSEMVENDLAAKAVATYKLSTEKLSQIDLGYNYRNTKRDFEALVFNHRFESPIAIDLNNADALFNQQSLNDGLFELQTGRGTANNPRAFEPFTYNADRSIHAALGTFSHAFGEKLTVVAGARFEKVLQEIEYDTNIASSELDGPGIIDESYILPNLNLKYSINDKNIIRAAASMNYTLPQFIEIAPFKYDGDNGSVQGNPGLQIAENINFDLKYEFYPSDNEIVAITGFYKAIDNAISRAEIPSGGNTLTFLNVGEAKVMGVELELKKNLYTVEATEAGNETVFSGGLNISYLNSKLQLDDPLAQFTEEESELQGASPLLVNADLTYRKTTERYEWTSSLVANYFSDRVYSIGTRGFANIVEKGIPTLDFITQADLGKNFGVSLKLRNLLDPEYSLTRESNGNANPDTTLEAFKLGVDVSLGLTYKF
jgi:hypothetical protein